MRTLCNSKSWRFSAVFSSKSFIVLHLYNFWVQVCVRWDLGQNFWCWGHSNCFNIIYWKDHSSSLELLFALLKKISWVNFFLSVCGRSFLALIVESVFLPIPHCLGYCSSMISPKIGYLILAILVSQKFYFFSNIVLIPVSLPFI